VPQNGAQAAKRPRLGEAGGKGDVGVSVDDVEGGRLAVAHLLEQGHLDIAVVGGRGSLPQVAERRHGAELARSGHDQPGSRLLVLSSDRLDAESGRAAAGHLSSLPLYERPTAVFAMNDPLAIGLCRASPRKA
jgi:LacI family transcriptional regulator